MSASLAALFACFCAHVVRVRARLLAVRLAASGRPASRAATSGRAAVALLLVATLALPGCASRLRAALPGGERPPDVLNVEFEAPRPLAALLRDNLDLSRVNRLAAGEPLPEGEVDRLVAAAPEQARSLLDTEGYVNAQVRIERLGGTPPRVRVVVEPGPRATVSNVDLRLTGPAEAAASRGETTALEARKALAGDWPLKVGEPFRNADWSRAKNLTLARVRGQGYVGAQWTDTEARIDAATHQVSLLGAMASGVLFLTGPLRITGLKHHDEQTVRNLAAFGPGTPATETLLLDFQERLQKSNLFDGATVTLEPDPADPQATTVNVRLAERALQDATLGVGISANVGARATVEHTHRRPFGAALIARNKLDIAQRAQSWEGELATHPLRGLWRNLVAGAYSRQTSDNDAVLSTRLRVGRAQDTKRISRLIFVEAERSSTLRTSGQNERASAVSGQYQFVWRDVDDVLLPTRGQVWNAQVGVGQAHSDPGGSGPFTRAYAKLNLYRPIGGWYAQARLEAGQVFARGDVKAPETLRFRAGGDESVRGYAYRSLAPIDANGVTVSGDVLFTASAEIARPLLAKLPALWGAAFIDAGRAGTRFAGLKPALGYGVGVRYRSPVGPVRVDLAYGQEVHRLRLHLNVGTSF